MNPSTTPPDSLPHVAPVLHRLYLAGAEVLAAALARELRGRYRFTFLCLDEVGPLGAQLQAEGFGVVDLRRRPGVDWSVARRIRRAIRVHGIDLLHPHQYTPFFYAAAARLAGRRPPILFTEHGRHYPDSRRPKRVVANRFLLRGLDRVTAVGEFSKRALVENEGIPARRIEVIYNGVDPGQFKPEPTGRLRAEVRAELGLTAGQAVVLQVARFHPVKDHATSVKAMKTVVGSQPDAVLLLVGDGERRGAIEANVKELGLEKNVRLLGVREDVARLMPAADVFVLSSLSEAVSVTLLEAMGAELPIAATDVGGNGEVVEAGVTGLLSARQDAAGLGQNIARLLGDGGLRARMGKAGRERLLKIFRQDQMHERYAEIYRQMLGR